MYRNPNKTLFERVMDFNYYLCLGTVEQNLEIVNDYGQIELVPILDIDSKNNWEVLEDSKDEILAKDIQKVVCF